MGATAERIGCTQAASRHASPLRTLLEKGHYDVKLPKEDMHRINLWLDSNSDFYGSYENLDLQSKGEIVFPRLNRRTSSINKRQPPVSRL